MKNINTAINDVPFRSLVAFEATARNGSLSRAADELNLTQSAVSQRVFKLEAFVGQRLFLRQGHGVKLTGAGALLLETTRETLRRLHMGFDRLEPYANKASLLVACPPDFAQGWLMPRLQFLSALHADIEVWMVSDQEAVSIDRIDIDLIVARKPLHDNDVESVPLLEDRSIAVCGPRTALKLHNVAYPKLLERAPLLFLEGEPQWAGLLANTGAKPLKIRRAATLHDERLLLQAAEHELGVAYLSDILAQDSLHCGRTVRVEQVPTAARPRFWAMRSRLTPRSPIVNRAFDWLLAQAELSAQGRAPK
jgi:LysR family glycine cleavage system transcriptional activator